MKKYLVAFSNLLVILIVFMGCQPTEKQSGCSLFIYGSTNKVYKIIFNGVDSIETVCGAINLDYIDKHGIFLNEHIPFLYTYMRESQKLKDEQAYCLISILERLNSKVITDTIKGEIRDVWNIYLSLGKQNISLQTYGIKDPDIQMLVDSLKEYSPIFINDYANDWWGLEREEEMIRMYDKRRK